MRNRQPERVGNCTWYKNKGPVKFLVPKYSAMFMRKSLSEAPNEGVLDSCQSPKVFPITHLNGKD